MTIALFIAGTVTLIVALIAYEAWRKKQKIEAVFLGRPSLSQEKFHETYFMNKGIPLFVVTGVRSILEKELDTDMSRLTDTDDFSKNLNFFWNYDSMADVAIICEIEKKFGIKISDNEAQKAHTVADIITLVHGKLDCHEAP